MINSIREAYHLKKENRSPVWVGKNWKKYTAADQLFHKPWMTIALYETGRHFNIPFADLVYFHTSMNKEEFLAFEAEEFLIEPHQIPPSKWNKRLLTQIIFPENIIRIGLLEMLVGYQNFPFELMVSVENKYRFKLIPKIDQNGHQPIFKTFYFQRLMKMIDMNIIIEEIESFFALLDNKLMDLLVFTMASVFPLWKDQKEEKEVFIDGIFEESKQHHVKSEFMTGIYIYKMK